MLKPQPPVPQNVSVFGDTVLKDATKSVNQKGVERVATVDPDPI
jgi:hypothetical protein